MYIQPGADGAPDTLVWLSKGAVNESPLVRVGGAGASPSASPSGDPSGDPSAEPTTTPEP
jgi:hypothetical protein